MLYIPENPTRKNEFQASLSEVINILFSIHLHTFQIDSQRKEPKEEWKKFILMVEECKRENPKKMTECIEALNHAKTIILKASQHWNAPLDFGSAETLYPHYSGLDVTPFEKLKKVLYESLRIDLDDQKSPRQEKINTLIGWIHDLESERLTFFNSKTQTFETVDFSGDQFNEDLKRDLLQRMKQFLLSQLATIIDEGHTTATKKVDAQYSQRIEIKHEIAKQILQSVDALPLTRDTIHQLKEIVHARARTTEAFLYGIREVGIDSLHFLVPKEVFNKVVKIKQTKPQDFETLLAPLYINAYMHTLLAFADVFFTDKQIYTDLHPSASLKLQLRRTIEIISAFQSKCGSSFSDEKLKPFQQFVADLKALVNQED